MQLATRTKMFCGCELVYGDTANTRLPGVHRDAGVLPVMNTPGGGVLRC